jgi:hypothetical protein
VDRRTVAPGIGFHPLPQPGSSGEKHRSVLAALFLEIYLEPEDTAWMILREMGSSCRADVLSGFQTRPDRSPETKQLLPAGLLPGYGLAHYPASLVPSLGVITLDNGLKSDLTLECVRPVAWHPFGV